MRDRNARDLSWKLSCRRDRTDRGAFTPGHHHSDLIATARDAGMMVIHVVVAFRPGHQARTHAIASADWAAVMNLVRVST
jgi:hypothetical protein